MVSLVRFWFCVWFWLGFWLVPLGRVRVEGTVGVGVWVWIGTGPEFTGEVEAGVGTPDGACARDAEPERRDPDRQRIDRVDRSAREGARKRVPNDAAKFTTKAFLSCRIHLKANGVEFCRIWGPGLRLVYRRMDQNSHKKATGECARRLRLQWDHSTGACDEGKR